MAEKFYKYKQKEKFKLRIELIGIFLTIAIMITLSIVLRLPDANTKLANAYTEAGSSLTSDHVYVEMNYDELVNKIETSNELVFIYFGSPECTNCVTEITTINSKATYWDIEEVIYFDATDYIIDEDAEDYEEDAELNAEINKIEERLSKNVKEGVTDISLEFTPAIWVFEKGELIFNSGDYLNDDQDGMTLSWSQIADRAFCINLPSYESDEE